MAYRPDKRRRYYVRLADIPIHLRLEAARAEAKRAPDEGLKLMAIALHPDPDVGDWVAEPLGVLLGRRNDIAA